MITEVQPDHQTATTFLLQPFEHLAILHRSEFTRHRRVFDSGQAQQETGRLVERPEVFHDPRMAKSRREDRSHVANDPRPEVRNEARRVNQTEGSHDRARGRDTGDLCDPSAKPERQLNHRAKRSASQRFQVSEPTRYHSYCLCLFCHVKRPIRFPDALDGSLVDGRTKEGYPLTENLPNAAPNR